tara:strand:- start:1943 stop:3355 length:1413 start_codon:yes stop_codon:yes gene_type:complete
MITQMDKIIHLDELPYNDFITFIKNFENIESTKDLEVSEKIDGQNCSFGFDKDNVLFVKTKKSRPIYDLEFYEEVKFLDGFQKFHCTLLENTDPISKIKNLIPLITKTNKDFVFQIFGELVPDAHTNTIVYNENKIKDGTLVIFDFKVDGKSILEFLKKPVIVYMIDVLNKVYNWNFIYKPLISLDGFTLEADIISKYEEFYTESKDFINARKKVEYCEAGFDVGQSDWLRKSRFTKKRIREILTQKQNTIKKIFLENILENKISAIGDSKPEGTIFRDRKNNLLVKLVDKDDFAEANKATHEYSTEIRDLTRNINKEIKNQIFNNADILKNHKKVLEKITDNYVAEKQLDKDFEYKNIDELLLVIYSDMVEENRIIKDHKEIIDDICTITERALCTAEYIKEEWEKLEKDNISNNIINITNNFICEFIKNTNKLLDTALSECKTDVSLSILRYLFGKKKIRELKKFISI